MVARTVKAALKTGTMDVPVETLNRLQSTAWAINEPILDLMKICFSEGIEIADGFVRRDDLPLPQISDEAFEAMSEDEKRRWRLNRSDIVKLNLANGGKRTMFRSDLATADWIVGNGNEFYMPYNYDFRGRVYPACAFNHQRADHIRSLFRFSEGAPLTLSGWRWLMIHCANCGDFDKVSKKPFEDRVLWVMKNWEMISAVGSDPQGTAAIWSKADKPFMFVAACIELVKASQHPEGPQAYVCSLPISFDGTCSGLQHLSAMTRAPEGSLVNLTDNGAPQDVYQAVADALVPQMEAIAREGGPDAPKAQMLLDYGISRALVKRSVMTYCYGSAQFGMGNHILEDTMEKLEIARIEAGSEFHALELPEDTRDFDGRIVRTPGRTIAMFLGRYVYRSIENTVTGPAEAMKFLQKLSKAPSHEGKPIIWHTPVGFPVVFNCREMEENRVSLNLHSFGVRSVSQYRDTAKINKRKARSGISPSFVHSYDACHLMMVVTSCPFDVAVIHDSFGCLPCHAEALRATLTEQFYQLYAERNPLEDILRETSERLENSHKKLPSLPEMGSLDLREVRRSNYAFA
jgi:DNA-directed RNA polymerase